MRESDFYMLCQHNYVLTLSHKIELCLRYRGTSVVLIRACSAANQLQMGIEVLTSPQLGSGIDRDYDIQIEGN